MIKKVLLACIHFYQIALSPFLGKCCRFYPSCSEYGKEAIEKYGPLKGLWKTLKRIAKCNPFCKGGVDPA